MKSKLYWITGLSGAGKTTIGRLLYSHLQEKKEMLFPFQTNGLKWIRRVT